MYSDRPIGIVFNARVPEAQAMAKALLGHLEKGSQVWVCAAGEMDSVASRVPGTGLIITVGGDGTILRATRLAAPHGIPLLGVNLGRVGFLTELTAQEALDKLPRYLDGETWVEERTMLQAQVLTEAMQEQEEDQSRVFPAFHAVNDVVVGRGAVSRLVNVAVRVDGALLTTYRADAVILSTATGSTAYNLSAGGPILHPQSKDIILKPVASHLGLPTALVLPSTADIRLTVLDDGQSMVSVDGHMDLALSPGDCVRVRRSPHVARFLRGHPPSHFYETLLAKLGVSDRRGGTRATS